MWAGFYCLSSCPVVLRLLPLTAARICGYGGGRMKLTGTYAANQFANWYFYFTGADWRARLR